MAVTSGLFNSKNGDRKYDAVWFAKYFSTFIGNGVFPNPSTGLQILDNENMTTICKPGDGWINGYFVNNDSDLVLYHDVADGILDRIDRIVMQLNYIDRQIYIKIKKGISSATPVAPEVVRNLEVHELVLADVYIAAGATVIDQSNIVDERLNSELCGVVHGVVDQVDTTTIFNQYQSWFEQFSEDSEIAMRQFVEDLNGLLDGDIAANLLSRVIEMEDTLPNKLDITGTAASATKLVTPRLIDGILFDGQQQVKRFATCSTEPEVQNKLVTVTNVDLVSGTVIIVKFTKGNTHAQPKIDLRRGSVSEGIKDIMRNDGTPFKDIPVGGVYTFVYDGTAFILQGESGVSSDTINATGYIIESVVNSTAYSVGVYPGDDACFIKGSTSQGEFRTADLKSMIANVSSLNPIGQIGNLLFCLHVNQTSILIYDMTTGSIVYTISDITAVTSDWASNKLCVMGQPGASTFYVAYRKTINSSNDAQGVHVVEFSYTNGYISKTTTATAVGTSFNWYPEMVIYVPEVSSYYIPCQDRTLKYTIGSTAVVAINYISNGGVAYKDGYIYTISQTTNQQSWTASINILSASNNSVISNTIINNDSRSSIIDPYTLDVYCGQGYSSVTSPKIISHTGVFKKYLFYILSGNQNGDVIRFKEKRIYFAPANINASRAVVTSVLR